MTLMRATLALGLMTTTAMAGGVDRSGQGIGVIFEKGNVVELSFGHVNPSVSGRDLRGTSTGSVANSYTLPGLAVKYDYSSQLSAALIFDSPIGADVFYPTGTGLLSETMADMDSIALTGLLRWKFDDQWSVHGGLRAQRAKGDLRLAGPAYGALNGYNASMSNDWAGGYTLGVAYEKPEIALRAALTYHSAIEHDVDTIERIGSTIVTAPDVTTVKTPQSVNLDFQTGIMADTLLFASARWVDWSVFRIQPTFFTGATGGGTLTDLHDTTTYTLGIGRKFSEQWSGSAFVSYEAKKKTEVSPLAPTSGSTGFGLAAIYSQDNMKIQIGARYMRLGDANAAPGGTPVASMTGNKAVALGVKVGFAF